MNTNCESSYVDFKERRARATKSSRNAKTSSKTGGVGFEPTTASLGGALVSQARRVAFQERSVNWSDFKTWLDKKYSKGWSAIVFQLAKKHEDLLFGDLGELSVFSKSKKNNVLKALIALSKYLGVYEQFQARRKQFGIHWERQNALQSFLRIINVKDDVLEWFEASLKALRESEQVFMKFALLSGLRRSEAINSFNLIVEHGNNGALKEYYNLEKQTLEHFRFEELFIRGTKNAFITIASKSLVDEIVKCERVSYNALRKRLQKRGLKTRINELRDFQGTWLRQHGLIQEEVDLLHGRIGDKIFMKHYFSPNMIELRNKTLRALEALETKI